MSANREKDFGQAEGLMAYGRLVAQYPQLMDERISYIARRAADDAMNNAPVEVVRGLVPYFVAESIQKAIIRETLTPSAPRTQEHEAE